MRIYYKPPRSDKPLSNKSAPSRYIRNRHPTIPMNLSHINLIVTPPITRLMTLFISQNRREVPTHWHGKHYPVRIEPNTKYNIRSTHSNDKPIHASPNNTGMPPNNNDRFRITVIKRNII